VNQIHLSILYEDNFIIAINKPTGLLVHRSKLATNTSTFAVQELRNQVGHHVFPIHRIDRKTSGVLLFAKDKSYVSSFQKELSAKDSQKEYHAIVRGFFPQQLRLEHPLRNDQGVTQDATTQFVCVSKSELPIPHGQHLTSRYSLIKAFPQTGRMHQIRKHCNHLRHPIIGDRPHGCNKQNKLFLEQWGLTEMLLHAYQLKIKHPFEHRLLEVKAPYFSTFEEMLNTLDLI
jgi:tRNA pseudouridine65 synthase